MQMCHVSMCGLSRSTLATLRLSSPEPYFMFTKRSPVLGIKHVILMYFDCYKYFYASKMCCLILVCVLLYIDDYYMYFIILC